MTRDSTAHRYGKLSITLHWLMLALCFSWGSRITAPLAPAKAGV
ncbi:cytochrome b561 [Pseudomonas frederiksbergensis]